MAQCVRHSIPFGCCSSEALCLRAAFEDSALGEDDGFGPRTTLRRLVVWRWGPLIRRVARRPVNLACRVISPVGRPL